MGAVENIITDNLPVWSSAVQSKSSAGRGTSSKRNLYGVKKLRELILDLAVRGLLVPQDPNDEPASVLLERIAAEKGTLAKEGKIKNLKSLLPLTAAEFPNSLPSSWEWARLGEITNYGMTDKAEPKDVGENTWVLELEDVEKETSRLIAKVRFSQRVFKSSKNSFQRGDVIYGKLRPYLDKVLVADEDGVCSTEMIPLRGHLDVNPQYLRLAMKSPRFKEYANNSTHGMNLPRMGTDKARLALIPICALPEQHRIVTKVDELMALCDTLEQQQEDSIQAHENLVEALLAALTDAADADAFQAAWQRISENFDVLFTTEHSIEKLKETILQLAVMGKLVPQDPSDEPAKLLSEEIAANKMLLVEEGLKTKSSGKEINTSEKYICVPNSWECLRLGDMANFIDYRGRTPKKTKAGTRLITAKNIKFGYLSLEPEEFIAVSDYSDWMTRGIPQIGDVLFTTEAPLGNVAIIDLSEKFALAQRAICLQFHVPSIGRFVALLMMSIAFQSRIKESASGMTATGIKSSALKEVCIALPPLAEQHRIVAKVDQLMALCDQLKDSLQQAQQTQIHLTDAVVENAL